MTISSLTVLPLGSDNECFDSHCFVYFLTGGTSEQWSWWSSCASLASFWGWVPRYLKVASDMKHTDLQVCDIFCDHMQLLLHLSSMYLHPPLIPSLTSTCVDTVRGCHATKCSSFTTIHFILLWHLLMCDLVAPSLYISLRIQGHNRELWHRVYCPEHLPVPSVPSSLHWVSHGPQ